MAALDPYPPLNVPKPLDRDLWVVDGPVVRMRHAGFTLPFSTRMTVARLPDGRLWLHSPTEPTDDLLGAVDALGEVAVLIAPNRLHWMALPAWQAAYPAAVTWGVPELARVARERGFRLDHVLTDGQEWQGIDQVLVPGGFMTEAVFLHRPTTTLILTDLIENFEPGHVHSTGLRLLMRLGGVLHPTGGTPRDLRLTFLRRRREARAAAETMLGWAPHRIVMAHGRIIEDGAEARLRRALAWTGAVR